MSSSGERSPMLTHPSLVFLLIISLFNIRAIGPNKAEAIRVLAVHGSSATAHEAEISTMESSPPIRNQTQIIKGYLNGRVSDINGTEDSRFLDSKRKIPSCPDPLHN
ncbi:CLAVATA3/ESR (CLE)-related protein 43 [Primulina eburnea]|uniref:CLAVATA3/ESR (CLE)-related protein 43 n=1 Tax=Primulina eburnea TaxID=1245227 RepID=UPI003C6C5337